MGESGSGKDTIAEILKLDYGFTPLKSYTTRHPRYEGENTHIFVTPQDFAHLHNKVAFTSYNGHVYCATEDQVNNSDIYVIDPDGVNYMKGHYKGQKEIICVYIKVSPIKRFWRMLCRGDGIRESYGRIKNDKVAFKDVSKMADVIVQNENSPDEAAKIIGAIYYGG